MNLWIFVNSRYESGHRFTEIYTARQTIATYWEFVITHATKYETLTKCCKFYKTNIKKIYIYILASRCNYFSTISVLLEKKNKQLSRGQLIENIKWHRRIEESLISRITDKIVNAKRLLCRGALIPLKWENFKSLC